ncbi:fructose-specific phosphotransferase system protein FrvX [Escherichia coli]|uniref:Fructose-specific phosphotransferase system protein FrvX n=1 Tax=Escherichia coli TaxID=562 RepID=A0A377CAJ4_ECOLX|nr:fructose-specific phosphotransferase system protein FrvX [Escherichia coli]
MNIELLQQLCEASAVSGDEQEVRDILINTLEPCVNEITFDGLGSFVARKGNKGPKVAVVGHMDEVGFMVTTSTRAVFCVLPPLAAGGISRCSTTG